MAEEDAQYRWAVERFAAWGVSVADAEAVLASISLSIHCWQGDDVAGFESDGRELDGGLAVTGNYPGRARSGAELRNDLELALSEIAGRHRVSLHAHYAETHGARVDRHELTPEHFRDWMSWAQALQIGLDFNSTFFAHPRAADGGTLSHRDPSVRAFWIEHARAARRVAASMGQAVGSACLHNLWIPDGMKDQPVDRWGPRERLTESLDQVFATEYSPTELVESVEAKLFGIGSESYVVGSHEFYIAYALTRRKWLCLDMGHFHPTESIADKLSSLLPFLPGLLLHVSRGVRWDSDHVVTLNDDLMWVAQEWQRGRQHGAIRLGLDFFDASINRVAAWIIGARSLQKALLISLLQPWDQLMNAERSGDYTARLAWQEAAKELPWGIIWDHFCAVSGVAPRAEWLSRVRAYERAVLAFRAARE